MKPRTRRIERLIVGSWILSSIFSDVGLGQELVPESVRATAVSSTPFAVSGSARKALPSLDCTYCTGPAPCVPCDSHLRGFLYYGTYPGDDDCMNKLDDCPCGNCGSLAESLSRAWINWHQRIGGIKHRDADNRGSCRARCANDGCR